MVGRLMWRRCEWGRRALFGLLVGLRVALARFRDIKELAINVASFCSVVLASNYSGCGRHRISVAAAAVFASAAYDLPGIERQAAAASGRRSRASCYSLDWELLFC